MEIVVLSGPDAGKRVDLTAPRTIGREPGNDLTLVDSSVSGRHALLRPTSGAVELTDLSSRNGTWLNGQRVTVPSPVTIGSTIQVGQTVLQMTGPARGGPGAPADWQPAGDPGADLVGREPVAPPQPPAAFPFAGAQSIEHAGPVAGGNISISGHQAAGRDLHYHEGFRIRSRMSASARRLLKIGLFLFFVPSIIGAVAIVLGQQTIFQANADNGDQIFAQFGRWLAVAGIAAVVSFVGMAVIVIALVMPRDKVHEPLR